VLQLLGTHIEFVAGKDNGIVLGKKHHTLLHLANGKGLDGRIALLAYIA
jgi:hypothetical protein